jgi:hypothetical protein
MTDVARFAVAVAVWLVCVLGAAGFGGRTDGLRRLAQLFGVGALVSPLLIPPTWVAGRVVLAAFGVLALGRSRDLVRRSTALSFWGRVWLLTALFDVREAVRRPPRFNLREAGWLLVHLVGFGLAWLSVFEYANASAGGGRPDAWALRWGVGVVVLYSLVESLQSISLIAYAALGIELGRVNDYPIVSTTLAEFWGRRWNRVVSGWLNDNLFFPLARRRRVALGICAAFAGSTLLHFWFAWVPLGLVGGAMMAGFFVVQAVGILLERRLGVARWPSGLRRAWTFAWLLLPSPLFIEPALQMLSGFE